MNPSRQPSGQGESARQQLSRHIGTGDLRCWLEYVKRLSPEARDLLIEVVGRYCEPRTKPRSPK